MARHRKVRVRKMLAQVLIPALTLGGLLSLGGYGMTSYASDSHQAVSVPARHAVAPLPPAPPFMPAVSPVKAVRVYEVQPADNWWELSSRFCGKGASESRLAGANHLSLSAVLFPGKVITITC